MTLLINSRPKILVVLRGVVSAGFLFGARAITVIYQLRYAEHAFGTNYGGLIALLNQVTFYILMAELGLASATTSLLFEPVHRNESAKVKALLAAMGKDVRRILLFLAPASATMAVLLAYWLRKQVPFEIAIISILLTCASAMLTFAALPYQSHFNASDRVPVRNVILGLGFAGKVTLGIFLAQVLHSFVGLPLGMAIIGILELLAQRSMVKSQLGDEPVTAKLFAEAKYSIRHRAKFVLAHRIGYLFGYQSDYIILLLSSSLALLGYYAHYQYLYAGLLSFTMAVSGTLTARVARKQIGVGRDKYPGFYCKTSVILAGVAALCGGSFYLLAGTAVHFLYHNDNGDPLAVLLFSILLMLNVYKMNDDLWIDTTGTYQKGYLLPLFEACSYVTLGLVLVNRFHIPGILYAGIATNLLFSVIFKSNVIGSGVMRDRVAATAGIKLLCLALMGGFFYAVVGLSQWSLASHIH